MGSIRQESAPARSSLLRLLEISQIRRRLILLGRHQESFRAQEVIFLADDDLGVALGARGSAPVRISLRAAPKCLVDAPGPRQGLVAHGAFVTKQLRFALV